MSCPKLKSKNESNPNLTKKENNNFSKHASKQFSDSDESVDDSLLKIKQKANDAIKNSFDFALDASHKIDQNIKEGIQKAKTSSVIQEAQAKVDHIRNMDQKEKNKYKRKFVRGLVKFRDGVFELFERFVGRIRIGTQYGKTSMDLLSDLAKLKELGILTEKEFELKKKEILGRI